MKLASLNQGRDGKLIVVDKELSKAVDASDIAATMQSALDNWAEVEARLQTRYEKLKMNEIEGFAFDAKQCHSPLPRAYHWADGSAYVNHVELVRKARGAEMPERFWTDPLIYQGGSDTFLAPHEDIVMADEKWGIDLEAEIAVVVDDVPMGVSVEQAEQHIKLVMLVNDVSLRNLIPNELQKGFGFYQSKPSSSFSPVAVSMDELAVHWRDGKLHLPLQSFINGELLGKPNAGVDMTFNFAQLIAHAAKTRKLCAGTIIGSGTVSNIDRSSGSSCLAEVRMLEKIQYDKVKTPFLKNNDVVKIEMLDSHDRSIFGAIEQRVVIKKSS